MDFPGCHSASTRVQFSDVFKDLMPLQDYDEENDTIESECSWWKRLLKIGVYTGFVQERIVQAQFFKVRNAQFCYLANLVAGSDENQQIHESKSLSH